VSDSQCSGINDKNVTSPAALHISHSVSNVKDNIDSDHIQSHKINNTKQSLIYSPSPVLYSQFMCNF